MLSGHHGCLFLSYVVLCTRFVNLLSAEINVSGPVGSTAVLPCNMTCEDTETPYIRWNIKSETVFEGQNGAKYEGEGYEGRVDVPVEELRKGNCSLVLHNLTFTDTGDYTSYHIDGHTKRSVKPKVVSISHVKLSVHNRTEERSASSDNRGRNHHYLWILVLPGLV
ncbi:butyrophilin subfamily 3 member A2-like isoform 2-T3 [Clarias gariepinus]